MCCVVVLFGVMVLSCDVMLGVVLCVSGCDVDDRCVL